MLRVLVEVSEIVTGRAAARFLEFLHLSPFRRETPCLLRQGVVFVRSTPPVVPLAKGDKAPAKGQSQDARQRVPTTRFSHQPVAQGFGNGFGFGMYLELFVDAAHVE